MKAKVIKTGRIIEVEKGPIGYVECASVNINGFPMQNFYAKSELDFNISTPEKAVIEGWVARDDNGELWLYQERPYKEEGSWYAKPIILLSDLHFLDITPSSDPQRVKIEITLIDDKEQIQNIQNSIRHNAKYLYSLYLQLHTYKNKLYCLYTRKLYYDLGSDEEELLEIEISELTRKYNDFKEYVIRLEKEQKERKIFLKRLQQKKGE